MKSLADKIYNTVKTKALAEEIYNILSDMDFADYEENKTEDLQNLTEDLELLKTQGNGTLLSIIETLID